jgi:NAD(P)H-dependent FMN reductase
MIYIISGTNRIGSRTLEISKLVHKELTKQNAESTIINLAELPLETLHVANYGKDISPKVAEAVSNLNKASGIVVVAPEYNGSYPGILKYFIDHFSYPETFEYRPVAFVGLGGRWGGLRPVEHLQQVFNYRNAFVFPERVFLSNIWETLKNGELHDANGKALLEKQAQGFVKFIHALKSAKLDATSIVRPKA